MADSKHGVANREACSAKSKRYYKASCIEDLLAAEVVSTSASDQGADQKASHGEGSEEPLLVLIVTHKVEPTTSFVVIFTRVQQLWIVDKPGR